MTGKISTILAGFPNSDPGDVLGKPVMMHGIKIGQITSIDVENDEFVAKLFLDNTLRRGRSL